VRDLRFESERHALAEEIALAPTSVSVLAHSAQSPVLFDCHLRRSSCPLRSDCAVLSNGVMFFLMAIGQTSTAVLAILDDDESVQIALQDLIESEGLSARCLGSVNENRDA
jgi:hypothetical protein